MSSGDTKRLWVVLRVLVLTITSAALFGLSFPPTSWKPLAWVALAPYLVALRSLGLRGRLALGALAGVLFAYSVGQWFARSVSSYYQQPTAVGAAVFFAVALTMVSPYYVVFAAAYGPLARRSRALLPLVAAAAWVGADLLRGRLFTGTPFFIGNPWALLGYSQVGNERLVQVAALAGVYGVTFALVAANVGLAEGWRLLRSGRRSPRAWLPLLGAAALPGVLAWSFGALVLRQAPSLGSPPGIGAQAVAIMQGNLRVGSRWQTHLYGVHLESYLRLTLGALRENEAVSVAFWPEAAMTFFLEENDLYREAIASLLRGFDVELVTGGPAVSGNPPAFTNSVFLLSSGGNLLGRYDKQYLVPFAEYFPLRIDPMRRRFGRIRVFSHGSETPPLPTAAGRAGILVCNEAMLPEVAGQRVAEGAEYLVNPSNDTWISEPGFVQQQFDIVALRAVEQRRYLVRASTSGPSGIVDPWGRVVVATQPATQSAVVGSIVPRSSPSLYGRIGDAFAFACLAIAGFAWAVAALTIPGARSSRNASVDRQGALPDAE